MKAATQAWGRWSVESLCQVVESSECRLQAAISLLLCRSLFHNSNGQDNNYTDEERLCFNQSTSWDLVPNRHYCPDSLSNHSANHTLVPMYFVCSSAMVASGEGFGSVFASFGIITLYTTVVLSLGRVLRWSLTGKAIMVRPPQPLGHLRRKLIS